MKVLLSGLVGFFFVASTVFAGECKMSVTRVPCPGKDKECFAKCNGQATCDEIKKVGTIEACSKEAFKNCHVFRPGTTKAKKISAMFDGKPVEGGKNFCDPIIPEFNYDKCK